MDHQSEPGQAPCRAVPRPVAGPGRRQLAGDATVTIGSLNLHCGLSGRGRPFAVPAALEQLKADIIAVQEGWWTADGADALAVAAPALGARLIRAEVSTGASLAELSIAPQPERGTWGIAVLTALPVAGIEIVDLGRAPGDRHSRAALICTVTTPGGWPLRLACTHLTHRFTSPVQLVALTRHLARTPEPPPTVIVGDLNMPRLATWLAAGFRPTVRGRTFPADGPMIQLDQLLISPRLACRDAEVLAPVGSDHLPIRARLGLARPGGDQRDSSGS